ncbi:MAG TPA: cytochrome P450 [Gaiellaceae bacterium]|nr:cytochrome P450 [Gaiellaceae bacterium]
MERKYDLYSHDFRTRTYETFAEMREHDPVLLQGGLDETPIWFVSRYDDAVTVLMDDETFVRDVALAVDEQDLAAFRAGLPESLDFVENHMLNKDGDDHRRLRRLVSKAFTPRMIGSLRPRVQEIADELLDAVEDRGEMELVDDFAFPLPITVIAELLGIPAADRDRFREWSSSIVTPAFEPEDVARFTALLDAFVAYLRDMFAERRANPRDDLTSALLQVEESGDTLSEQELYSMVVLLIVAGHETTVSLLGNAVLALLTHPAELERLAADPGLVPEAVEELIRYDGPVERALTRWAATDTTLGGKTMKRGEPVVVVLGAANRDRERFPAADTLDVTRPPEGRHLGFGRGSHFCLGAPLARLEAEVALTTLLRRLPGLRLVTPLEDLYWRPVPLFRSLAELRVAWG